MQYHVTIVSMKMLKPDTILVEAESSTFDHPVYPRGARIFFQVDISEASDLHIGQMVGVNLTFHKGQTQ